MCCYHGVLERLCVASTGSCPRPINLRLHFDPWILGLGYECVVQLGQPVVVRRLVAAVQSRLGAADGAAADDAAALVTAWMCCYHGVLERLCVASTGSCPRPINLRLHFDPWILGLGYECVVQLGQPVVVRRLVAAVQSRLGAAAAAAAAVRQCRLKLQCRNNVFDL